MQRFLFLRLLSKNHTTSNGTSYISNTLVSSAKTNLMYTKNANASSVSQYSTTAFSRFLAKPDLVNKVLQKSNALFKDPSKGLLDFKRVFSRSYFLQKRSFSGLSFNPLSPAARKWFRRIDPDNLILVLIATNIAILLAWPKANRQFMIQNFMIGRAFDPEFLLKLYLAGAIGGSVFYLIYHAFLIPSKGKQMGGMSPSSVPALGASGAVNAIMLLEIFLNPKKIIYFHMIIPVPALLAGVILIGKDMLRVIKSLSCSKAREGPSTLDPLREYLKWEHAAH